MNNNPMQALARVITSKFIAAAPQEAAQALAQLATHEVLLLVGGMKAQSLIAVLNRMDAPKAAAVLRRLASKQAGYVLTHLQVPQAAKLWKEFAAPYRERLKKELPAAFVALMQAADQFPQGSVGYAMITDYVAVSTEDKVVDLIGRLKNLPRTKLPLVCFVQGKNGELKGILRTVELAFFTPTSLCGSVMNKATHVVHPQDPLKVAQAVFATCNLECLPVINEKNILIGVLGKTTLLMAAPLKKTLWAKLRG